MCENCHRPAERGSTLCRECNRRLDFQDAAAVAAFFVILAAAAVWFS